MNRSRGCGWPKGKGHPFHFHPISHFLANHQIPMRRSFQILLLHFLLFCQLLHSSICSCCCCDCCCCCCPCCCCCCGSSNNNNNDLALSLGAQTGTTATTSDDDFTLGAQSARQNTAGLGPGLLPDGSTGRTNQQQQNNPFGDQQFGGRRRRKRGLGILGNSTKECCGCRLLAKRMAIAMPFGSKPKQKPILPSDWTMSIAPGNEPSLGPGLLPDGSTGRRQRPMNGENHFAEFFGNNGMNWQRRRRRQRMGRSNGIENEIDNHCSCKCAEKRDAFQLGLVPVDEMQHKNQTYLRFLLGLVPEEEKRGNNRKMRDTEMGGEFTIRRQFFLVPIDSTIKKPKKGRPQAENVQSVLPKPPLQFYKAVVPNPENDQERFEPDYD